MDLHGILQSAGSYIYLALSVIFAFLKMVGTSIYEWFISLPFPTVMKLFGNPIMNKAVFAAVAAYILAVNIAALAMFLSDKKRAQTKRGRIPEKKLIRVCVLGGAIGGIIGMSAAHHKTNVKKFKMTVPALFIIQLLVYSMVLGFLGFWAFF